MEVTCFDERTLTELDHARIARLVRTCGASIPHLLEGSIDDMLDAADLVPSRSVPPDVVTMYSLVEVSDLVTGRTSRLAVCYPPDAQPTTGYVSVLSPVGASLIGRGVGSIARWRTPDGEEGAAKIMALLFQPEASGDYTM